VWAHHDPRHCSNGLRITQLFRIAVASIRSMGDSYDDGFSELAEALSSLYKAELISNKGPWQSNDDVEVAPFARGPEQPARGRVLAQPVRHLERRSGFRGPCGKVDAMGFERPAVMRFDLPFQADAPSLLSDAIGITGLMERRAASHPKRSAGLLSNPVSIASLSTYRAQPSLQPGTFPRCRCQRVSEGSRLCAPEWAWWPGTDSCSTVVRSAQGQTVSSPMAKERSTFPGRLRLGSGSS